MRKRLSSLLTLAVFACSWSGSAPTVDAGSFVVPTRDDVLIKTSQIQATQFLTHATFGGTEQEINDLALRMRQIGTIAAAAEWLKNQQTNPMGNAADNADPATYRHQPLAEAMIAEDFQFCTAVNNAAVSIPMTSVQIPNQTRYRQFAWWHRSIANPDQLRQKTAWALSQICAVGNNFNNFNEEELEGSTPDGSPIKSRFMGLSNYYDIFINRAFDTYRNVVGDVTYHGIMGDWLSHRGNSRASGGLFPDENYAREVMQLFTIGLYKLQEDGQQINVDADPDDPDPTYTQKEIGELAKVFTGLGYNSSGGTTGSGAFSGTVRFQFPMTMSNLAHDTSLKDLDFVLGADLPAITPTVSGTSTAAQHTAFRTRANDEIKAALDGLCNHTTHPVYISRLLIQRLVKSNPSRAYINRVVQVFKAGAFTSGGQSFGTGVRGDLKAVIPAILLDPEAWQPIRTQYFRGNPNQIVVTTMGSEDSRLQEPVVNYTRFFRFFKASARYEKGSSVDVVQNPTTLAYSLVTTWDTTPVSTQFRLANRNADFSQGPYDSPTVFNFYVSDYQPAGDILNATPSSRVPNGALMAPEFQIVDAITANRASNAFRDLRGGSRSEGVLSQGNLSTDPVPVRIKSTRTNTANDVTTTETPTRTVVRFGADSTYTTGFARECAIVRGANNLPTANTATLANVRELIEHLDLYMCGGTLNEGYRTRLITLLHNRRAVGIFNPNPPGTALLNSPFGATITAANALEMVQAALTCITNAPSFLVTE